MRLVERSLVVLAVVSAVSLVTTTGCASLTRSRRSQAGPRETVHAQAVPDKTPIGPVSGGAGKITTSGLTRQNMPPHPFMLFSQADIPTVARRKTQDPLLDECWMRLANLAERPDVLDDTEDAGAASWHRAQWWEQLEARAFLAEVGKDPTMAARGISLMQKVLQATDPDEFYGHGGENFHIHAAPLRALALAWDWLYQDMTAEQRAAILPGLERWCDSCYTHTNHEWWREASYNVGAIPVGGIGLLSLAIRGDSTNPNAAMWLREATRRIGQNYYPNAFRASGICYEGPNYSIVGLKYPAMFSEALRRAGGEDQLGQSGAIRTMQYQMYEWMPQGGCTPIGDNTDYGRRTFAAEYLLGISRTRDAAGLWTWRNNANLRSIDSLVTYLWYPVDLKPVGPAEAKTPPARYFEVTPNRAGYFFSRTKWEDPDAAFFAFVSRYDRCNHQHYDMNSFLLGGFGTLFATHEMLFPYGSEDHGVDFEHNMVIVDDTRWPQHDTPSCGDDNSTEGVLEGLATGPFGDYMRGEAKWSYRDNSIITSNPAVRAERSFVFVKAGATPYMVVFDDIQFSDNPHNYRWQWYTPADVSITGAGTTSDPILLAAKKGSCALSFITPETPAVTVGKIPNITHGGSWRSLASQPAAAPATQAVATLQAAGGAQSAAGTQPPVTSRPSRNRDRQHRDRYLQRIDVKQTVIRARYAAIATLQLNESDRPVVQAQAVQCESPSAGGAQVRLVDGTIDQIAWQSQEMYEQRGSDLTAGPLQTDGLMALVRVKNGQVVGYVLGEGTYLRWNGKDLVKAPGSVCVSADADGVKLFGRRRAHEGLPPIEPVGVMTYKPVSGR